MHHLSLCLSEIEGVKPKYFDLMGFRVIGDTASSSKELNTESSVKIKIGNEVIHTVSEGDGPVHSLDRGFKESFKTFYPRIKEFKLSDFKVRILNSSDGTDAKTRVHIETTDGYERWDTVGVSKNLIEAAYTAIVDSIEYGFFLHKEEPKHAPFETDLKDPSHFFLFNFKLILISYT